MGIKEAFQKTTEKNHIDKRGRKKLTFMDITAQ